MKRLVVVAVLLGAAGCAANRATQSLGPNGGASQAEGAPITAPDSESSDRESASSQTAQQSGQVNTAAQVYAGGWKGIEVQSVMPAGMAALLAWMSWLSHRREMTRIRQNGKHGSLGALAPLKT